MEEWSDELIFDLHFLQSVLVAVHSVHLYQELDHVRSSHYSQE